MSISINFIASELKRLFYDDSGIGTIELVLILVVLIGLVALFKEQIEELLETIFESIESLSGEIL